MAQKTKVPANPILICNPEYCNNSKNWIYLTKSEIEEPSYIYKYFYYTFWLSAYFVVKLLQK